MLLIHLSPPPIDLGFTFDSLSRPGVRGLFDGISGTWLRQMSYSMCRFWAYDESKKIVGATGKDVPAWKLALAGSMGQFSVFLVFKDHERSDVSQLVESRASLVIREVTFFGQRCNICGFLLKFCCCSYLEIVMVRLQGDFAKPPEKRFNYKHCFDALFRVSFFFSFFDSKLSGGGDAQTQ